MRQTKPLLGPSGSIPRRFFEQHVRPNYEEWLHEPLNERRAKNAVSDANVMAARVFHYWKDQDPNQIYGHNPNASIETS